MELLKHYSINKMLLNNENLFLIVLTLIWIIGAVLQDLKRREVDNLWNFSLIAFALAYRFALSVFNDNYWFVINGLIGLIIFLFLGNLFYYSRLFAGGDAKLLIALGAVLPLSYDWLVNFRIFGLFTLLFLVTGSIYALIWALFLIFANFKRFNKEFSKQVRSYKNLFLISLVFALLWVVFVIFVREINLILIAVVVLLFPVLFIFAKSVEESCMIKLTDAKKVTEGDWLYQDIKVGNKVIRAHWEGVSKNELKLIKEKYKGKVLIKQGVPFTPSFLFGFILLLIIFWRYRLLF